MADHTIKLAGENEHLEHSDLGGETGSYQLPTGVEDDCELNQYGRKAREKFGVPDDIAILFKTPESIQALKFEVSHELAHQFKNEFQTSALTLLGEENAELALAFNTEILKKALEKALDLKLDPRVALQVTGDSLKKFAELSKTDIATQAMELEVPLKDALEFNQNSLDAWKIIKPKTNTEKERATGVAYAMLINSHASLDALKYGVHFSFAHKFTSINQGDAWKYITSTYPSIIQDKAVELALKIDTNIELLALQAEVDPEIASSFVNEYQTNAWSKKIKSLKGSTAKDALTINTKIRYDALMVGASPEDTISFTEDNQVKALALIIPHITSKKASIPHALGITKKLQVELLQAKTVNEEDVNIVEVLEFVKAAGKFETIHQVNVLHAGADPATAKVAVASTHEVAYIKHGVTSPDLLKKFDAQHKIDLLEAGIDKETASETGSLYAQYLLLNKLGSKKYLQSFQAEVKFLQENKATIWDYVTSKTAALIGTGIVTILTSIVIIGKALTCLKSRPAKGTTSNTQNGGVELGV